MKQIHPILLQVCYNFVADYIILFFIKRDLFPEKKQFQIIKAAAIFSMTYGQQQECPQLQERFLNGVVSLL